MPHHHPHPVDFFFLFAFESRHKTKIPATPTGQSLRGVFFPLPHLAPFALLSLVCLTSLCLIQEPPLRQSEQCALYDRLHTFPGLLKVWDNLRCRKSNNKNNNNNFNPPVRLSFEEFLDTGQSTHRQTYSDWLWSSWFPPTTTTETDRAWANTQQ